MDQGTRRIEAGDSAEGPADRAPSLQQLLEHRSFVHNLSRKLTSDPWLAADIEQQAWVVALERPPRHARALEGWFARVLRSCLTNSLVSARARLRREAEVRRTQEGWEAPGDGADTGHDDLRAALEAMPDSYADIIRWRYFDGHSSARIAERLGLPVNTVRSRLQRGLARLGDSLERRWRRDRSALSRFLIPWAGADPVRTAGLAAFGMLVMVGLTVAFLLGPSGPGATAEERQVGALLPAAPAANVVDTARAEESQARTSLANPASRPGELRVLGVWADGSPAAGVGFWLESEGAPDGEPGHLPGDRRTAERGAATRTALSDGEGAVRWEELAPGNYLLFSTAYRVDDSGTVRRAGLELRMTQAAGKELRVRFGEPRPLVARVAPAPGAELGDHRIDLSLPGSRERTIPMGRSDAAGEFRLSHFEPESWISADRGERGMSLSLSLDHPRLRAGGVPELLLEPMERANELHPGRSWDPLRLTVLDPGGEFLGGAQVELHPVDPTPQRRMDGMLASVPVVRGLTDEGGRCTLHFNGPGPVELRVAHREHPEWRGRVGTMQPERVVRLGPGGCVTGVVRDAGGRPVAGAPVAWRGDAGDGSSGGVRGQVRTDERGRYSTPRLAPGGYDLWSRAADGEEVHVARGRVELEAEGEERWDPRLQPARWLRGRATTHAGLPLADHWVALLLDRPADPTATRISPSERRRGADTGTSVPADASIRWSRTDDSGRFGFAEDLRSVDRDTVFLALYPQRELSGMALVFREVAPFGIADLVVEETAGVVPRARLTVRLDRGSHSADGHFGEATSSATEPGVELLLCAPHNPVALRGVREGNRWQFEDLVPGRYSVLHWGFGSMPRRIAEAELEPGDLIELEAAPPRPLGRVELALVDTSGLPVVPRQVDLMSLDDPLFCAQASLAGPTEWLAIEGQGRVRGRVPAGEYLLIVRGERAVHHSSRLRVPSTETLRADVVIRPAGEGARQAVRFDLPPPAVGRAETVWLEFRTADGEVVHEDIWTRHAPNLRHFVAYPRLPAGDLVVRARVYGRGATFESEPLTLSADRDRSEPIDLRFLAEGAAPGGK